MSTETTELPLGFAPVGTHPENPSNLKIYLFGSVKYGSPKDGSKNPHDIDLITVNVEGDMSSLGDFENVSDELRLALDVFLITPDWDDYVMNHDSDEWMKGWAETGRYNFDIGEAIRSRKGTWHGFKAWRAPGGHWEFSGVDVDAGYFDHVDFSQEVTPDEIRDRVKEEVTR